MKRIQALSPGIVGSGRTEIEVRPGDWRNVLSSTTRIHCAKYGRLHQTAAWCIGADGEYRQSIALSVRALIDDVHSPMDAFPVHARWDVVY